MRKYATVNDVEQGFRTLTTDERETCEGLLGEAAVIIDAYNADADAEIQRTVSCRMVRRAIGTGQADAFPLGASQGTVSALGYSQTWTMGSGTTGELYLGKLEKKLLGVGNKIGSHSPIED